MNPHCISPMTRGRIKEGSVHTMLHDMTSGTDKSTRRNFLTKFASVIVGSIPLFSLVSGCAATGLVAYRQVMTDRRAALKISDYPELKENGGAIELDIDTIPNPVVVVRASEKEFLALSPICTHLGCTVRKEPSVFRCPCHGSTYALDGSVVRGPAEKSLWAYRTEFVDNKFIIHF